MGVYLRRRKERSEEGKRTRKKEASKEMIQDAQFVNHKS